MRRGAIVFVAVIAACAEGRRSPPAQPLGPPPEVELVGCAERRPGAVCEIVPGETTLTLWVAGATAAELRFFVDDAPLSPDAAVRVQDGLRVEIAPRSGELAIGLPGRRRHLVQLVEHTPRPGLDQVVALRRSGELDAADAALAALAETGTVAGAMGERARNLMARGRIEEARQAFEQSIRRHERAGRQKALVSDSAALTYLFVNHGYPPERAQAVLSKLDELARADTWAAILRDYFGATLAVRGRDPRSGLHRLRRSMARNLRLGRTRDRLDLRQYRIILLRQTGRWAELRTELDALEGDLSPKLPACPRAQALNNLGWHRLLGARRAPDRFTAREAREALQQSAELYRARCPRPLRLFNAELNAGWAALFEGDGAAVRRHLAAARGVSVPLDVDSRLNLAHLEAAQIAQGKAHRRAATAYAELAVLAEQARTLDIEWQAHLGRGRALEAQGRLAAAAAAYRRAQDVLRVWALRVPLGEGRDTLLDTREQSARALVAALTKLGRSDAAIAAIRRVGMGNAAWARQQQAWRGQVATEEMRRQQGLVRAARAELDRAVADAWALPVTALPRIERANRARVRTARAALDRLLEAPAPAPLPELEVDPREALLFAHPIERGMVVGVRTRAGLSMVETASTPLGLSALGPHLKAHVRVGIYAHPTLLGLPWDRIPVEGTELFRRAEVVFHADLGSPRPLEAGRRSALVVADPAGALPRARREGARVASVWQTRGWTVQRPSPPLTVSTLSAALGRAPDLFHYSGHGVREGLDGLDGGFPLGDGRRFTVVDVLALPAVPRRVVLAACDLGSRETAAFSMAQAFLLKGTEVVVAAVRPVDDGDTAKWVEAFHRHAAADPAPRWPEVLRKTRVELADADPPIDAGAFRTWLRE